MIKLKKYVDIFEVINNYNCFTIDLSDLSIRDSLRVIDFLTGIVCKSGSIYKINRYQYKVSI